MYMYILNETAFRYSAFPYQHDTNQVIEIAQDIILKRWNAMSQTCLPSSIDCSRVMSMYTETSELW